MRSPTRRRHRPRAAARLPAPLRVHVYAGQRIRRHRWLRRGCRRRPRRNRHGHGGRERVGGQQQPAGRERLDDHRSRGHGEALYPQLSRSGRRPADLHGSRSASEGNLSCSTAGACTYTPAPNGTAAQIVRRPGQRRPGGMDDATITLNDRPEQRPDRRSRHKPRPPRRTRPGPSTWSRPTPTATPSSGSSSGRRAKGSSVHRRRLLHVHAGTPTTTAATRSRSKSTTATAAGCGSPSRSPSDGQRSAHAGAVSRSRQRGRLDSFNLVGSDLDGGSVTFAASPATAVRCPATGRAPARSRRRPTSTAPTASPTR